MSYSWYPGHFLPVWSSMFLPNASAHCLRLSAFLCVRFRGLWCWYFGCLACQQHITSKSIHLMHAHWQALRASGRLHRSGLAPFADLVLLFQSPQFAGLGLSACHWSITGPTGCQLHYIIGCFLNLIVAADRPVSWRGPCNLIIQYCRWWYFPWESILPFASRLSAPHNMGRPNLYSGSN